MQTLTFVDHIYVCGLCLMMIYAVVRTQPQLRDQVLSTKEKLGLYRGQIVFLYAIAIVAVAIWYFHNREFATIGFRLPGDNYWVYGTLTAVFVVSYLIDSLRVWMFPELMEKAKQSWKKRTPFMPENSEEMKPAMHMAVCAGICEEIVFRGFFYCYFLSLLNGGDLSKITFSLSDWKTIVAISIPAIIFSLSHLYHGWGMMFKLVWLSLLFGFIFVASESLLIVVILHVFVDVMANLMSPSMLIKSNSDNADSTQIATSVSQ